MFNWPAISGRTINSVALPPSFTALIYAVGALALALGYAYFTGQKHGPRAALQKAAAAAFFASGLAYALYCDAGWVRWLIHDWRSLSGKTTDEKLAVLDGSLYEAVRSARGVLGDEYEIVADNDYLKLRAEYLLLPRRRRPQAPHVLVLKDNGSYLLRKR